jgi:uncharacterized DUF497 family protein
MPLRRKWRTASSYTGGTTFRWVELKAEQNFQKHGIAFEEAATVFDDPLFILPDASLSSIIRVEYVIPRWTPKGFEPQARDTLTALIADWVSHEALGPRIALEL